MIRKILTVLSLFCLLLIVGLIHGCHREIAMMFPNRLTPPKPLKQSTETVVKSMYAHLAGSNEETAAGKLYGILQPGVGIYYLFAPESKHPIHHEGEWRVNLYQLRWHATVYPLRRASVSGKTYELWVLHYRGQGPKWSRRLRPHHYYGGTEASSATDRRQIIFRSEEIPGQPDIDSVEAIVLPNGRELKLPLIGQ